MLERAGAKCELHCFHKKDDLKAYLLEKKRRDRETGLRRSLLFFKLLIDDASNVSFARQICDLYHLPVIFVTDQICYAYLLYDTGRQYYLWPPFSKERVAEAIKRMSSPKAGPRTPMMSIIVSSRAGNTVLSVDDIIYCESVKRVTLFVTAHGTSKMYIKLSEVEAKLTDRFIRCHQSFLVNFRYVRRVGKSDIELTGGMTVPISQRKRRSVLGAIEAIGQGEMA
jgi:DNA-binding LytR/AlgR family response regulator